LRASRNAALLGRRLKAMSDLVSKLGVIAEDDIGRYEPHVKRLAGAAADRISELEDVIETAYGILWCDAGGFSATAAFDARKVLLKVLDRAGQQRGIDAALSRYGPFDSTSLW
jgi:hypothetical protein